jgi:hypothetical protein
MNNDATLQQAMDRKPFQPLRLYLKDGRVLDIPARYYAVLGTEYLAVGKQAEDQAEGICSSISRVPLWAIDRTDILPTLSNPASEV